MFYHWHFVTLPLLSLGVFQRIASKNWVWNKLYHLFLCIVMRFEQNQA